MMSINAGACAAWRPLVPRAKAKDALAIAAGEQGETAEAKYVEATIAVRRAELAGFRNVR